MKKHHSNTVQMYFSKSATNTSSLHYYAEWKTRL